MRFLFRLFSAFGGKQSLDLRGGFVRNLGFPFSAQRESFAELGRPIGLGLRTGRGEMMRRNALWRKLGHRDDKKGRIGKRQSPLSHARSRPRRKFIRFEPAPCRMMFYRDAANAPRALFWIDYSPQNHLLFSRPYAH